MPDSPTLGLLTAAWIVPVAGNPIPGGGVVVLGDRIIAVGPAEELRAAHPEAVETDLGDVVVTPGLVNAHTHLSLTALEGLVGPRDFPDWLAEVVPAMRAWGPEEHAASAALGAWRLLRSGTTAVGDIVYGPEALAAATGLGLAGTFYWEVLGIPAEDLAAVLDASGFPGFPQGCARDARYGLSPHSPYTSGPELLTAVHALAQELGVPFAIHVAESPAETDLLLDGTGPLAEVAGRAAVGFSAPGEDAVAYLYRLRVLHGAAAVHLGQAVEADLPLIADVAAGAVTCPRSNTYLGNAIAPVPSLLQWRVPVGVGTDSAASNHDLDLLSECRALGARYPELSAETLLDIATRGGATVLGIADIVGTLEPGKRADLAAFRLGEVRENPASAIVERGGHDTLVATMAGGRWRVWHGEPAEDIPVAAIMHDALRARETAEAATQPE